MLIKRFGCRLAYALCMLGVSYPVLAQQSSAPGAQSRLGSLFSNAREDELLEPEQAFRLKVTAKGPTTLIAELIPAQGYYLYKDKIRFTTKDAAGVSIKTVRLPSGEIKNDRSFGKTETYNRPVQAEITLERAANAKSLTLVAAYQGCHEKLGVCYPPVDKAVKLTLP